MRRTLFWHLAFFVCGSSYIALSMMDRSERAADPLFVFSCAAYIGTLALMLVSFTKKSAGFGIPDRGMPSVWLSGVFAATLSMLLKNSFYSECMMDAVFVLLCVVRFYPVQATKKEATDG